MGYTTEFSGQVTVTPALSPEEITFLNKFSETRRMDRTKGPYFVDGTGDFGQGHDADIVNFNEPPKGQPGLWCQWIPTEDGTAIVWNGAEKFYEADAWMAYLIDHFIGSKPLAAKELPFLKGHKCDGEIEAQGEDSDDRWKLIVEDNRVSVKQGRVVYR